MGHSKNLKSRRPKVRMNRKNHSKFIKPDIPDATIRVAWQPGMTLKQNYEAMGLVGRPQTNKQLTPSAARTQHHDLPEEVEWADLSVERNAKRANNYVSEEEAFYLKPLIDKHGDDYTAMARDIKLNKMQHTEAYLRRRCTRYVLYMQSQKPAPTTKKVTPVPVPVAVAAAAPVAATAPVAAAETAPVAAAAPVRKAKKAKSEEPAAAAPVDTSAPKATKSTKEKPKAPKPKVANPVRYKSS